MKIIKLIMLVGIILLSKSGFATQFKSATIKVTGVTCSMCSNTVYKALSSLKFINKIDVDVENAVFNISFNNEQVVLDELKNKVVGAGFSVGELLVTFDFDSVDISKDYHLELDGNLYHFVNVQNQTLEKNTTIKVIDKGFTSNKIYKKYVGLTTYSCIKTGYAGKCCKNEKPMRVYHVTI